MSSRVSYMSKTWTWSHTQAQTFAVSFLVHPHQWSLIGVEVRGSDSAPPGTSDYVWRHFWSSLAFSGWMLEMPLHIVQCTEQSPQQRIIQTHVSMGSSIEKSSSVLVNGHEASPRKNLHSHLSCSPWLKAFEGRVQPGSPYTLSWAGCREPLRLASISLT